MQYPWVGKHYSSKGNFFDGKKILIVGESHYGENPDNFGKSLPEITREFVADHLAWETGKRIPFFTRLVALLTGTWGSQDTKLADEIWHHLAFYNYVPVIAAVGPRMFDWSLWEKGEPEFNTVLEDLKPDAIIVLGYRLWQNAYYRHCDGTVDRMDTETKFVKTVFQEKLIPTMKIVHPSSAKYYKPMELHHRFKEMLSSMNLPTV